MPENISQLLITDTNETYDIRDETSHVFYVKGTQTAATGAWTGNLPEVDALYEGLAIDYWLPFNGNGNATLNLTLKNGATTGAINCFYSGATRLTTHIGANNIIRLVYQTVTISGTSYTGWWLLKAYDTNDAAYAIRNGAPAYQANSAIYCYQLLFQVDDNKLTPLNNVNNSIATGKAMLTSVDFLPFGKIYCYNSTTNVAANSNMTSSLYNSVHLDLRYSLNCAQTLTAHRDVYLKCARQANGKFRITADPCWTQTLPSTNDGYYYLRLGRAYDTYHLYLEEDHPIYYHDGTELRIYTNPQEAVTDKNITENVEYTGKATKNYTAGSLAIVNNQLLRVTQNITSSGNITIGSNAEVVDLETLIAEKADASHTHSADNISGGYLNIHPENSPTLIPFMHNDIAFLLKRGGSAVVKYDNAVQNVDISAVFDGTPSYWYINPTGITTIIIELTLHRQFVWTNTIYVDFGSASWRAKSIKIEVMNTNYSGDTWTQKASTTSCALGHYAVSTTHTPVGASNAGGGFNKIRFTFSSFATATIFRIAQLGVYNYGSYGLSETFVSRGGSEIFGTINPYQNNGADLGTSAKYFNNAYVTKLNGVAVGSSPKFTDTNTWRGIQDNLTSDSATDSLSAKQGKALKGLVDAKAPLASPALTGNPTAPTQTKGNNSTRIATTAFVQAAINDKVEKSVVTDSVLSSATATQNYTAGKLIIVNNQLLRATQNIATGGAITIGSNAEEVDLETLIEEKANQLFVARLPFASIAEGTACAGYHNSLYREKSLGTSVSAAQYAQISAGTFDDMFVGDYWTINDIVWRIAGFDYWLGTGDTKCTTHHVVIVPDTSLLTCYLNSSNTVEGAYVGTGFYTGTNEDNTQNTGKTTVNTKITGAFGAAHILNKREILANATTDGYESDRAWYDSTWELMSEIMVFGCNVNHNHLHNNAADERDVNKSQLPLFRLNHSMISNRVKYIGLRDVANATHFCAIHEYGYPYRITHGTTQARIRPAFGICA